MQETTTPRAEFKEGIGTQELISILDRLTEWAKGKEEILVPVLSSIGDVESG